MLIDFLAGKGGAARRVALELEAQALATTAVSHLERVEGLVLARLSSED